MTISQEMLSRWQSIATITASIAIPLILAIFGFLVQNQIASEGLRKDYVQIAISILKDNPTAQEKELRTWAVSVLDENSPIPFSKKAKSSLEKGIPTSVNIMVFPTPPKSCMTPAKKLGFIPIFKSVEKDGDIKNPEAFIKNLFNEGFKAEENTASLVCLQEWIQYSQKFFEEYNTKNGLNTKTEGDTSK